MMGSKEKNKSVFSFYLKHSDIHGISWQRVLNQGSSISETAAAQYSMSWDTSRTSTAPWYDLLVKWVSFVRKLSGKSCGGFCFWVVCCLVGIFFSIWACVILKKGLLQQDCLEINKINFCHIFEDRIGVIWYRSPVRILETLFFLYKHGGCVYLFMAQLCDEDGF